MNSLYKHIIMLLLLSAKAFMAQKYFLGVLVLPGTDRGKNTTRKWVK